MSYIIEMSYIIVGYYTENTSYAEESKNLTASLDKLQLPYDVMGVPNQGTWQANTQYKAYFIQQMLSKHFPKNLLYLDVDAVVHKHPVLFDTLLADIGVHYLRSTELISSTIYLRNNAAVAQLVDRWLTVCLKNPEVWDQKVLQSVINQSKDLKLKLVNLPPEYCKIFDTMAVIKDPVIEQFQASRRFKQEIDGANKKEIK